jgi:lipopolysaccharide export system permease protein
VKTIHGMMVRMLLPVLLASMVFFVLLLELVDLFPNLVSYIDKEVSITTVLSVMGLYAPKCLTYAVPVGLIFAISFTLGTLYKNNELVALFGSGVSLGRLILPFVAIGAGLSVGSFFFQERVVIDTFRRKNELHQLAVKRTVSLSNANLTLISDDGAAVYQAELYDDARKTLRELTVMISRPVPEGGERSAALYRRYDAKWASWEDGVWTLHDCIAYAWLVDGSFSWERRPSIVAKSFLREGPQTFQKQTRKIDEMPIAEAWQWVRRLQRAGLPHLEALTEYYARYFFSLTPLIVAVLACSVGGRLRKNVLLMNLLLSLILSVVYYVAHMVAVILAKNGVLPPMLGAGAATLVLLAAGLVAIRSART